MSVRSALVAAVLTVLLAACATGTAAERSGVLRFAYTAFPSTLDPHKASTAWDELFLFPAYDRVVTVAGLAKPDSGQVLLDGSALDRARRKDLQMVFQDQSGSLDPMQRVRDIVAEPLVLHTGMSRVQRLDRVLELLDQVGLEPEHARRRLRELSGGQRQRVAIARAVACRPGFVVFDEPVSSVDAVMQHRVLSLLASLRTETGFGCLLISHDLGVVRQEADRVAVMRSGRLVETAPVAELLTHPQHEYTRGLIAAIPSLQARRLG